MTKWWNLPSKRLNTTSVASRSRNGSRTGDRTSGGYDDAYSSGHRSRAWRFNPLHAKRIGRKIESMRHRVAAVMVTIALALPAIAQHGAARGGSAGHGGFAGHTGFGHSGFTFARGISRPAPFAGQSRSASPAFGR